MDHRLGHPDRRNHPGSNYGGGIGGVLYTIRGGSTRSYNAYNSRGDVVSKTNGSGAITWQAAYEAFGTRTQEQGATEDRQKANTKDEDPTGLLNEGMRYRDLEFGVFITRDPAGFVDGPNVYTYVRQNPWTYYDPEGLWAEEVFAATISAAGRMASDIGHGVVQAGIMVEIAARASVGADTSGAHDRLQSVTNHSESFGREISTSNAEVYGADVNSGTFQNTELVAGILMPEPGSKIKVVGKADDIAAIIKKGGDKISELAPSAKATKEASEQAVEAAAKGGADLRRPYIRKGTRQAVEDAAPRAPDGRPIDPNTLKPIDGKPDLGHKLGNEHWREAKNAKEEGLDQKQFNHRMNDPPKYQLEDPSSNRSRRHEKKD